MTKTPTKAHDLLEALGLTIVKHGSGGRYPCGEPGPAQGYRYWSTYTEGQFKFGVQGNPKGELSGDLIARLTRQGFVASPNKNEVFILPGATLAAAIDKSRATMTTLSAALKP